jgi:hypothetical protein
MRIIFLFLAAVWALIIFATFSAVAVAAPETVDELQLDDLPSPTLLPDSPFYFLKTLKEKLQLLLAPSSRDQAELLLLFSQKRLSEALAIFGKGKTAIGDRLLKLSLADLKNAQEKILAAQKDGQEIYGVLQKLNQTADYQKLAVEKVKEGAVGVNDFLLKIDQRLVLPEPTESGKMQRGMQEAVEHPPSRLEMFWGRIFGKREVLRPLVETQ